MSIAADQHEIARYIKENPVAILGTASENNVPHGAAVYVCFTSPGKLYFVTKTETQKFKDMTRNPHVSITIVNTSDNSSLQATGRIKIEDDPSTIEMTMGEMAAIYAHSSDWLPPIAKLHAGTYEVISVKLRQVRLAKFKGEQAGSKHIFTPAP